MPTTGSTDHHTPLPGFSEPKEKGGESKGQNSPQPLPFHGDRLMDELMIDKAPKRNVAVATVIL